MRFATFFFLVATGCSRAALDTLDDVPDGAPLDAGPRGVTRPPDATVDSAPADASPRIDAAGAEPCLVGGNVFHVEGDLDDPVYPATTTVGPNDGTWYGLGSGREFVQVQVAGGASWVFVFATVGGSAIRLGTYDHVVGGGPNQVTYPRLELGTDGRGCAHTGSVTILAYDPVGLEGLETLTATFERQCDGATAFLRGCVHFQR